MQTIVIITNYIDVLSTFNKQLLNLRWRFCLKRSTKGPQKLLIQIELHDI